MAIEKVRQHVREVGGPGVVDRGPIAALRFERGLRAFGVFGSRQGRRWAVDG